MGELLLMVLGTAVAAVVIVMVAARPWATAVAKGHRPPAHASGPRVLTVAALLGLGIAGCLWLALDGASPGGLIVQLNVVAQLVPVMLMLGLGACLSALAWQPDWVVGELRRLAVGLPASVALVVVLTGLVGQATPALLVPAALGGAALFAMSRLLAAPARPV